jgi:hypothetical protein
LQVSEFLNDCFDTDKKTKHASVKFQSWSVTLLMRRSVLISNYTVAQFFWWLI